MNWELILEFAVAVAAIAVTLFLVPWLREKLGQERAERLEELIWKAAQGLDPAAHDADIEAAVLQVNQLVA